MRAREWLWAAAAFLILAVVYTRPVLWRLDGLSPSPDYFQFNWNFWWARRAVETMSSPFFTDYQYHPTGTSLALHTTSPHWAFLSVPLQYLFPTHVILNAYYLLSFWITALTTTYLLRCLDVGRWPALVGAFVFTFSVHRLDRFITHEIDSLGTMYIPLCVLAIVRVYRCTARREPVAMSRRSLLAWSAVIGVSLALSALSSWYNGLFLALFAIMLGAYLTMSERSFPVTGILFAVMTFGVVVGPFLAAMISAKASGTYPEVTGALSRRAADANNADLAGFFVPYWRRPSLLYTGLEVLGVGAPVTWARSAWRSFYGNPAEKAVFVGYAAFLISGTWAAVAGRFDGGFRRRLTPLLVVTALAFGVLSLGPRVRWMGQVVAHNPVYDVVLQVPLLNVARAPSRAVMMVMFSLAILVAFALHGVGHRLSRARGTALCLLVGAIVFVETVPVAGKWMQPRASVLSPFFERFSEADDRKGVILNVPVDFYGARGEGGRYLFEQTYHRQKIVGGYLGREPKEVLAFLENSRLLRALHHDEYGRGRSIELSDLTDVEVRAALRKLDVTWVVVHPAALPRPTRVAVLTRLSALLGPPSYRDALIVVFDATRPAAGG